jgi:hypothetical protein
VYKDREQILEECFRHEKTAFLTRTVAELLTAVAERRFGDFHAIWDAIAEKATLEQAGWPLARVLRSDAPPGHRIAAADALLQLLPGTGLFPVDIAGDRPAQDLYLDDLEDELRRRVGPSQT